MVFSIVPSEVISTSSGQLQGSCLSTSDEYSGICTYAGIPFAKPPINDLRWRPPVAATPWSGVRKAVKFGEQCLQPLGKQVLGSEDCLFLNVWAPPKANCRDNGCSVAFWIHGGSYTDGGTDPAELAPGLEHGPYNATRNAALAKDVIFVSTQYRLNILGFAGSHELKPRDTDFGSTGNYGILDQRAALTWVHENIHFFGGDATKVMIYGESAGAGSVSMHLTMPRSFPLYSKAVIESGAW